MKDAARLVAYLAATLLFGALAAPPLYWFAQSAAAAGPWHFLAAFDFETFFHRALLIGAVLFLWPLLRVLRIRSRQDLGLTSNPRVLRDTLAGFFFAAIPLLGGAALLLPTHVYEIRHTIRWQTLGPVALTALVVPLLEEALFRGLLLGVLARSFRALTALIASAAVFAALHFLKAPQGTSAVVTWNSGFNSIAHSTDQFRDPMLVLASFTTLFLLGLILADTRLATRSLWLPIGLHAGWIFANGAFNRLAHREMVILPWLGNNLLIGLIPLGVALLTWGLVRLWLKYVAPR